MFKYVTKQRYSAANNDHFVFTLAGKIKNVINCSISIKANSLENNSLLLLLKAQVVESSILFLAR